MSKKTTEKAHNEGSEFTREGTTSNGGASTLDQITEFADKTIEEVTRMSKEAFTSDNAPKLAAGAAVGGVAALFLPVISLPLGALAGLGYVAYREANKGD